MQLGLPSSCQLASRMRDENGMVVADRWKDAKRISWFVGP